MYKNYEQLINMKLFEIITPEIYNKCLPKYFTKTHPGDLPMHNGVRMSWEEYSELHPEAQKDEEFVPSMIYDPQSMNEVTSMEPIATMIDLVFNNIDFSISDPEHNYPEIIEIIKGYIDMATPYAAENVTLEKYLERARATLATFNTHYTLWKARRDYRVNGGSHVPTDEFDRISKRFITPED